MQMLKTLRWRGLVLALLFFGLAAAGWAYSDEFFATGSKVAVVSNGAAKTGGEGPEYTAGGETEIAVLKNRIASLYQSVARLDNGEAAHRKEIDQLTVSQLWLVRLGPLAVLILFVFTWWRTRGGTDASVEEGAAGPTHPLVTQGGLLDNLARRVADLEHELSLVRASRMEQPPVSTAPLTSQLSAQPETKGFGDEGLWSAPVSGWAPFPPKLPAIAVPEFGNDSFVPSLPPSPALPPLPLSEIANAFNTIAAVNVLTIDAYRNALSPFGELQNAKVIGQSIDLSGTADAMPSWMLAAIDIGEGIHVLVPSCNYINSFVDNFRRDLDAGADILALFDLNLGGEARVTCIRPSIARTVDGDIAVATIEKGQLSGYTT